MFQLETMHSMDKFQDERTPNNRPPSPILCPFLTDLILDIFGLKKNAVFSSLVVTFLQLHNLIV